MARIGHRRLANALVAFALLAGHAAATRAAEADVSAPATDSLTAEWVGIELTPASVSFPEQPCCGRPGHVDSFQAGPGGSVRFFRYRWKLAYVIPIQAGVYVSSGHETIFAHVETEGGLIVPGTNRRLEVGIGFGLAALAIHYGNDCDGSCNVGGAGFTVSVATRYLFIDRPTFTFGVGARYVVPLGTPGPGEQWWGTYVADGTMLLGGIEVGFGRS